MNGSKIEVSYLFFIYFLLIIGFNLLIINPYDSITYKIRQNKNPTKFKLEKSF